MSRGDFQLLQYEVRLDNTAEPGRVHACIAGFPEAVASGSNEEEALLEAERALQAAALFRLERAEDLPAPAAKGGPGAVLVPLPAHVAAKAIVIDAFRRSNLSKTTFGQRLGVGENEARRILDPRHGTKLERMAAAAAILGRRLVIGERAA